MRRTRLLLFAYMLALMFMSELYASMSSITNSAQFLEVFMTLDAANLLVFVEENQSKPLIRKQFDEMIAHINQLEEAQLYELVEKGFKNGWPSHVVGALYGQGLVNAWEKRCPSATDILARIHKLEIMPSVCAFYFSGALRNLVGHWNEVEYTSFHSEAISFATNAQFSYESRSSVVDDLFRHFKFEKRMRIGASTNELNKRFQNMLDGIVLRLAREVKNSGSAAYALTRDSIRGITLMKECHSEGKKIAHVRNELVRVLLDPDMPEASAREILRAGGKLDLKHVLTPQDVERLGRDPRLKDSASQERLKALGYQEQP